MLRYKSLFAALFTALLLVVTWSAAQPAAAQASYALPDTGQSYCYDSSGASTPCPAQGEALFGQDANYQGAAPAYQNNGDGTITDLNTGLMWQQDPGDKVTWDAALANASTLTLGGYNDWRVPTIKELYSLINFSGYTGMTIDQSHPYLDTPPFVFEYGDEAAGERIIDAQFWSSTRYLSTTMGGNETIFGVNFADGRIKGYPRTRPESGEGMQNFVRYVRSNPAYGVNDFADNGDGTISDRATGLTWMQQDSGALGAGVNGGLNWPDALAFCEDLSYAGADDWRLPNAHELQSLVDYSRSPDTTHSAAIDPLFTVTPITDEGAGLNYPFYWTGTTHVENFSGDYAVYVAFGEALGFMETPPGSGNFPLQDVHGAGAQRSDPKTGDPAQFPTGHGPQGDVIRIYNAVRCVVGT